jgi:transmembrane sensor
MLGLSRKKETAPRVSRWWPLLLVLPVVLAVFLTAGLFLRMYSERSEWSSVSTAVGDYRRLPLADGSTLELNTATEVRYRLSEAVRELDLTAGEARFRVAHDAERPFVVIARDTVVRAVGTEFTVRIHENGKVDVVVAEGVVAVSHQPREGALRELLFGRVVPLDGGTAVPERNMVTDDAGRLAVVQMTRAKIEAHDAWRSNMLVFDETPLSEIVEEFNRFNRRKLEIADPDIGNVPIGGRYRPRDVEGFLRNLATVMKIQVVIVRSGDDQDVLRLYGAQSEGILSP